MIASWYAHEGIQFRIEFPLAAIAFFSLLRMLLLLELTKEFGPFITMIKTMLYDLLIFFNVWILTIMVFGGAAAILFKPIPQFKNWFYSWNGLFESSLGNWLLNMYDGLDFGDEVGEVFHIVCVVFNMILMFNLIIAQLAEKYANLSPARLGLYYDGLISSMPSLKYDEFYGAWILYPPPLNLIVAPLVLLFSCLSKRRVKKWNEVVTKILYLPVCTVICIVFTLGNILLMPFAYLAALGAKIRNLCKWCGKSETDDYDLSYGTFVIDLILWLTVGHLFMIISIFKDAILNFYHSYTWEVNRTLPEELRRIDLHSFVRIETTMR